MNIILLHGETESGKDTLALNIQRKFLSEKAKTSGKLELIHAEQYIPIHAYANSLKHLCSKLYNIPLDRFYNDKEGLTDYNDPAKGYLKVREIMQMVADLIKEFDYLFFDRILVKHLRCFPSSFSPFFYIISDWRFPHSVEYIREHIPEAKIRTVRLTKGFKKKQHTTENAGNPIFDSERSLDNFVVDLQIDNEHLSPEKTCEILMKRIKEMWFIDLFN
jgi:hypothetical protein